MVFNVLSYRFLLQFVSQGYVCIKKTDVLTYRITNLYYDQRHTGIESLRMSTEISPEREEQLIEQAAKYIVQHDLEDLAVIALEGTAPFGDVVGELGIMMSYPLAVTLFARSGGDFVKMLGFNYEVNATRLQERVEELAEEKRKRQRKLREIEKQHRGNKEGWFSGFSSWLRSLFKRPDDKES
jgi:hypothetical protein